MYCFSWIGRHGWGWKETHSSSVHIAQRQKSIWKKLQKTTTFYLGSSSQRLGHFLFEKVRERNANYILSCSFLCFSWRQCKCVFSWQLLQVKSRIRIFKSSHWLTDTFRQAGSIHLECVLRFTSPYLWRAIYVYFIHSYLLWKCVCLSHISIFSCNASMINIDHNYS